MFPEKIFERFRKYNMGTNLQYYMCSQVEFVIINS